MTIHEIFAPYEVEGRSTMILTGRSIYDFECREDGSISTLVKQMAEYAKELHLVMVRYSLAEGVVMPYNMYDKADVDTIKKVLSSNGIKNAQCSSGKCQASQELVEILQGISKMASSSNPDIKWQDGEQMRFFFLFEFTSDLMPTAANTNQLVARELIYKLAYSCSFLENGNLIILSDVVEGKIDDQVQGIIYHKFLPYPNTEEKAIFLKGLHLMYPNAKYDSELNDQIIANLSSSTPNRGLDLVFRAANSSGLPIDVNGLIEQKTKDLQTISEGTLTMLDTSRVKDITLKGENIRKPMEFIFEQARGLRVGDKTTYLNVVLMGAPGTGKTTLALTAAHQLKLPAIQLNSPKAGIVGETERKATLQARLFSSTSPCIGVIDEITEGMPVQRTQNLDSGASDAVMQAQLNMLSDESRAGKSLIVATTNCGFKMGAAMRDRFLVVPVIMPSVIDIPEIICSITEQISGDVLYPRDERIQKAAACFYEKHLMARRISAVLKLTCKQKGLTPDTILEASKDAIPMDEASWLSAVYADLCAISLTVSKRLLPWYGCEDSYPFPSYIKDILDDNCEVDSIKLNQEIKRLEPYVNV